jgi:hypothetical protein
MTTIAAMAAVGVHSRPLAVWCAADHPAPTSQSQGLVAVSGWVNGTFAWFTGWSRRFSGIPADFLVVRLFNRTFVQICASPS